MITCNRCSATWTGLRAAHCSACHETFGSVAGFDKHRINYTCRHPADSGLALGTRGLWSVPMSGKALAAA